MDRLTHMSDGYYAVDSANCWEDQNEEYSGPAIDRLADYEDTELEPEAVAELKKIPEIFNCSASDLAQLKQLLIKLQGWAEAEKEERLKVLPCKVGDTVWFNTYAKNATVCLGVRPHKVSRFDISAVVPGEYTDTNLPLYRFGKSVFLTSEEATPALEAKGENSDENGKMQ